MVKICRQIFYMFLRMFQAICRPILSDFEPRKQFSTLVTHIQRSMSHMSHNDVIYLTDQKWSLESEVSKESFVTMIYPSQASQWSQRFTGLRFARPSIDALPWTCIQTFSGTGLAFIAVADAIAVMPGGPFWAVLFFLMLLTLGLGSAFGTLEGFITPMFNLLGEILKLWK